MALSYAQGLISTDSQFPPDDLDEALIRGFIGTDTSANLADDLAHFLVDQLASEDEERANRAEVILGWLGGTGVKAAENAAVTIDGAAGGAARVLGQIGEESSIPTLREMLEHGANAEDRRAAAVALTDLRTPLAIEARLVATRDSDRQVRDAALAGLDTYGTMATVAMIGGVIRPGTDSVRELSRPNQNPLSIERVIHLSQVEWSRAGGFSGLSGLVRGAVVVVSGRERVSGLPRVAALAGRGALSSLRGA